MFRILPVMFIMCNTLCTHGNILYLTSIMMANLFLQFCWFVYPVTGLYTLVTDNYSCCLIKQRFTQPNVRTSTISGLNEYLCMYLSNPGTNVV